MREIEIDRRSWHFWFADLAKEDDASDFCAYVRRVIFGIVFCCFVLGLIAFACGIVGQTLAWIVAMIVYGWTPPEDMAILGAMITIFACLLPAKSIGATVQKSEMLSAAYTSFKEKVCFKVRIR